MTTQATGKAVNLRVRPIESADLCYPIDGVIWRLTSGLLGSKVSGINLQSLDDVLGDTEVLDVSRLYYGADRIYNYLSSATLSTLRNQPEKADLDNAIGMRQNAYLTTYSPDIISQVQQVFYDNPAEENSVVWRLLNDLQADTHKLNKALTDAYKAENIWGRIVKDAQSTTTLGSDQSAPGQPVISFDGRQDTKSRGFEFRNPSAENDMRYRRALASLQPEFLNAWRMAEMCKHGDTTFRNELFAIDQQIKKLQIAYVDTFLVAPFAGLVTGVFRSRGDYVTAGQPVVRVEDDTSVYLVGTVKLRGLLRVNSKIKVTTTLFDAPGGQPTIINGTVSAVRGHDSISEQWDVLILCENRTAQDEAILPLNYNFEFENTTIEVTAI
jgi:hypothetical protein